MPDLPSLFAPVAHALARHPGLLLLGWCSWLVLTAAVTQLARRTRTPEGRAELARVSPWLLAFVVFCEGFGLDLPKLLALGDLLFRLAWRLLAPTSTPVDKTTNTP